MLLIAVGFRGYVKTKYKVILDLFQNLQLIDKEILKWIANDIIPAQAGIHSYIPAKAGMINFFPFLHSLFS